MATLGFEEKGFAVIEMEGQGVFSLLLSLSLQSCTWPRVGAERAGCKVSGLISLCH